MKKMKYISNSAQQTKDLAEKLGASVFEGCLITLSGQLGAGKTTFTQGLAKGMGITKNVTSPTFTLLKSYQGRLVLNHIDAYRLEGINQDLGFDELIDGEGVTVIEWSNFISNILPTECMNIEFAILENDDRQLTITAIGLEYERLMETICTQ